MNKEERLAYQRERRRQNNNLHTKTYEKTEKGFLMRLYRNMLSRISGVQRQKFHLYEGKALLDKQEFYKWSMTHPDFLELFSKYKDSGWERKLAPSVDRINSSLGYTLDNMEWVTHSENSRRGAESRYRRVNESISNS